MTDVGSEEASTDEEEPADLLRVTNINYYPANPEDSPGYRRTLDRTRWQVQLAFGCLIVGLYVLLTLRDVAFNLRVLPDVVQPVAIGLVAAGVLLWIWHQYVVTRARALYYDSYAKSQWAGAGEAITNSENASDVLTLLQANDRNINAYDALARKHAERSRLVALVAMSVGLTTLAVGVWITYTAPATSARYAIAALTAVGLALEAYISKTFITVQDRATEQLSYYFQKPLLESYILTAERLAKSLGEEHRETAIRQIIDRMLDNLVQPASRQGSVESPRKSHGKNKSGRGTAKTSILGQGDNV
jgi:hypothetical protein